jgi:hypothetical protein
MPNKEIEYRVTLDRTWRKTKTENIPVIVSRHYLDGTELAEKYRPAVSKELERELMRIMNVKSPNVTHLEIVERYIPSGK